MSANNRNVFASSVSLLALGALAWGPCASAQEEATEDRELRQDEILVTAEKRAESVYDLPLSISAHSGAELAEAGVQQLRDLQTIAPSLNIADRGSETVVTVRGIGSEIANIGSEPAVTITQDGVVLSRDLFFNASFLDIGRVEVLRGPQGTISGRNATGGAINIISNQPTEAFEAEIGVTVGNYQLFGVDGFLSGGLDEDNKLLGRLAFAGEAADGWLRDEANEQDLGSRDRTHLRGILATNLDGPFQATLTLETSKDDSLPLSTVNIGRAEAATPSLGEAFGVPDADLDALTFSASQRRNHMRQQNSAILSLDWELSPTATLSSTTGYLDLSVRNAVDTDGTLAPVGDFTAIDYEIWEFAQELTLTADLNDRADIILGGLYLRDQSEQPIVYLGAGFPFDVLPVQDLESYAAYGQLRYSFTDALRLSLGLRYTHDEKEYSESSVLLGGALGTIEDSWNAVTPKVAIEYTPNDDFMLFANASRGFKAGGMNTLSIAFGGTQIFEPEYVWNYEAGVKGELLDGRVRGSVTGFFMDYSDIQQTLFGSSGGIPTSLVVNVPEATINGAELEFNAYLTDAFRIGFSATWLDATMGSFPSVDPLDPSNVIDLDGNRLSRAPEWQYALSGQYAVELGEDWDLDLRADYSWRDQLYFNIFNYDSVSQDAYGVLNLNAEVSNEHWSIGAFARNATDELYLNNGQLSTIIPGVPQNLGTVGEPRTYGVRLKYRY